MSEKLISADKLIRDLKGMLAEYDGITITGLIKSLQEAPAVDAVEVVRCKDCEHYLSVMYGSHCELSGTEMDKDGYCSYGERREDNAVD